MEITTRRCLIRHVTAEDWPGYLQCAREFAASPYRYYDFAGPANETEAREAAAARAKDPAFFAVTDRSDGSFLGYVCFHRDTEAQERAVEIGYAFLEKVHGKGFAAETIPVLIDYMRERYGDLMITAGTAIRNVPSMRLLAHLGFRLRETEMLAFQENEQGEPAAFLGGDFVLSGEGRQIPPAGEGEKKLCVLFPGVGYHCDKPLLYYAGKLAAAKGYEVKRLAFSLDTGGVRLSSSPELMEKLLREGCLQAAESLRDTDFSAYDRVVFAGKSIGTAVMTRLAAEISPEPSFIFYTPVFETFRDLDFAGAAPAVCFHGDKDPMMDTIQLRVLLGAAGIPLYVTEEGNHSLETGEPLEDLRNLAEVMRVTDRYLP